MRLFDESLYQFNNAQPSYWEASVGRQRLKAEPLDQDGTCEVAIIGGGYTGLSAAYHLAKEYGVDVRVLEAGHIGWGASGRNGGFVCMGGTQLSAAKLIRKYGHDEARRYYQCQSEAVDLVRQLAVDEQISYDRQGDCELVVAEKPSHFAALEEECEIMRDGLGTHCEMLSQDAFRECGYDAPHQHGALVMRPGFGLHPLKYCLGLGNAARRHGAILHAHSEVIHWDKTGNKHLLETASGGRLAANKVIVAANGFMPENLHKKIAGRALPLQSQIVVTRPLTCSELAAHNWVTENPAINSRNVYFYYRMLPDRRLLIGGRADFKGTEKGAQITAQRLKKSMAELWPEWKHVGIDYSWRGFVCFTARLTPAIGRLEDDPSVFFGFGYHGNGVNNATWTGRELARWIAGNNDTTNPIPTHLPSIVQGMAPSFPFPALRRYYATAGVAWHRFLAMIER